MATGAESKDSYTVGWIAALPIERTLAVAMLDEEHGKPLDFTKNPADHNSYSWGRIGVYNIVIAALPEGMYGQSPATTTLATHMIASFPQVRVGLVVGIGGGVPRLDEDIDIRLGDVVVSQPNGTNGGVARDIRENTKTQSTWSHQNDIDKWLSPSQPLQSTTTAPQRLGPVASAKRCVFDAENDHRFLLAEWHHR